jgi:hypothetical protein
MDDQRRFPLKLATTLSQQFAAQGLQFFKVNRTVTHVSVARPHYLDMEATPVSEGVKRIVDYINTHPKSTRRKVIEALAPAPAAPPAPATPPVPSGKSGTPAAPTAAAPAPAPEATPEQTALASDLHWLVHQGHVIEFANGILETAKKPIPRPPKPEKKAETPGAAPTPSAGPAGEPAAGIPAPSGAETAEAVVETEETQPVTMSDLAPVPAPTAPGETVSQETPQQSE